MGDRNEAVGLQTRPYKIEDFLPEAAFGKDKRDFNEPQGDTSSAPTIEMIYGLSAGCKLAPLPGYGGVRILKFINWYFGIISDLDLGN